MSLVAGAGVAAPELTSIEPGAPDPFAWLEDIHSPRALEWAARQNVRTSARLESDPRYELFRRQALAIFTAKDRIPFPGFLGDGVDNLWQDDTHVKGVWRRTTAASYGTAAPAWETLIDLDALSRAEGRNWIWKGARCLPPKDRLCLVSLSDGGGDAVEIRELDTRAKVLSPAASTSRAASRRSPGWIRTPFSFSSSRRRTSRLSLKPIR